MVALKAYVRNWHRLWWRLVRGVGVSRKWVPSWSRDERSVVKLSGIDGRLAPAPYDEWSPHRWEPSGTHPGDVRATPGRPHSVIPDEDEDRVTRKATAGMLAEVHDREPGSCRACAARARHILGGCDSTLTKAPKAPHHSSGRGWSPERARAAREKRLSKIKRPIDKGEHLTELEMSRFWLLRHKASICGSAVAVLQRKIPAAGVRTERIAVPLRCRTRECLLCSRYAADHAKARMEAEWRQLVTLTVRQDKCSESHAWRWTSRWVSRLMSRLQLAVKRGPKKCGCGAWYHDHNPNEIVPNGEVLTYAWVIEPHKKGWPHVHIAWDAPFVCFNFVRELWWEITGIESSGSWVEKVVRNGKIANYLAKYLSKGTFSTAMLALMWRRRIWASNVKTRQKWESGYEIVEIKKGKCAEKLLDTAEPPMVRNESAMVGEAHHWEFVDGVCGKFNRWQIRETDAEVALIGAREAETERLEAESEARFSRERLLIKIRIGQNEMGSERTAIEFLDIDHRAVLAWNKVVADGHDEMDRPTMVRSRRRELDCYGALWPWGVDGGSSAGAEAKA
jgi:hypothetical protein